MTTRKAYKNPTDNLRQKLDHFIQARSVKNNFDLHLKKKEHKEHQTKRFLFQLFLIFSSNQ
jgi:hypothetical protein